MTDNALHLDDDTEEVIDNLMKTIEKPCPTKKVKGRLNNHRVYLAGPIDHASDDGVGWREELTPYLEKMGLTILDPTNKPVSQCRYNEIGDEKDTIINEIKGPSWNPNKKISLLQIN